MLLYRMSKNISAGLRFYGGNIIFSDFNFEISHNVQIYGDAVSLDRCVSHFLLFMSYRTSLQHTRAVASPFSTPTNIFPRLDLYHTSWQWFLKHVTDLSQGGIRLRLYFLPSRVCKTISKTSK